MTGFRLHLLRHGTPIDAGKMTGWTDCASTQEGIAACVERAARLDVAAIISSDLLRARAAAEVIALRAAMPLTTDPRWRELDFGAWDGRAATDIGTDALAPFWSDPEANPPLGGERWSSIVARVGKAIGDMRAADTLVVTHAGAMRAALALLCGLDHRQVWMFDLPYASMLSLHIWPGEKPSAQIIGLYQ
ncbi:histidine phosphatase family protein [Sphingobium phenoxybenzoativorans]|uniref:Histidine phosphatase family protein n=1 Tax=Sphingobium phenoxybenzoativorans TaxID=1592790 RepID=A0A975K9N9_9SPHN|nr:histidine phosphatase family protein [Sphingobium phenoxybenzoativorans]QUT07388.1 histidine phosphatase family protein [Sphingobium phenoxybenzoativorans]